MTIEESEELTRATRRSPPANSMHGRNEDVLEAAKNQDQVRAVVIGNDSLFQRESQLADFLEPHRAMPFSQQRRAHVQTCMHQERTKDCIDCELFRGSSSSYSHCYICLLSERQVIEVQSRTEGETVPVRIGDKDGYFMLAWMPYSKHSP
jgi:hypothetical protein